MSHLSPVQPELSGLWPNWTAFLILNEPTSRTEVSPEFVTMCKYGNMAAVDLQPGHIISQIWPNDEINVYSSILVFLYNLMMRNVLPEVFTI